MITFIIGTILGSVCTLFTMSLMVVAKKADDASHQLK